MSEVEKEKWARLREWLENRGVPWTHWAKIGPIDSENAGLVLSDYGIEPTDAARARLRREVNAVKFE